MPIAAGDYSVAVTLDENAFDADDNYMHIRGSPFQVRVRARVSITLTLTLTLTLILTLTLTLTLTR